MFDHDKVGLAQHHDAMLFNEIVTGIILLTPAEFGRNVEGSAAG